MQLGEIKIAKNSRKFSNFHGTYYEKKSPILFRYTVRPPICGFFPFQKFFHKSSFVKKIGFRPQIGFCQKIGLCPQIGWKSLNRVGEGFYSYYMYAGIRQRSSTLNLILNLTQTLTLILNLTLTQNPIRNLTLNLTLNQTLTLKYFLKALE